MFRGHQRDDLRQKHIKGCLGHFRVGVFMDQHLHGECITRIYPLAEGVLCEKWCHFISVYRDLCRYLSSNCIRLPSRQGDANVHSNKRAVVLLAIQQQESHHGVVSSMKL
jgi:hypothetical protein